MDYNFRKYPRTLNEAFGPYAHGSQLHTHYDPMPKEDKIAVVVSALGLIVVVVMVLAGWIQ